MLKCHEVKGYLDSYNHRFTEQQVNIHLGHTMRDENVIGVIQNMSVDLISKSYSLANAASLRIMNRIRDFLTPYSCDATILSVDRAVYSSNYLSVELDVDTFYTVAEAGHVIMKVSFDECLIPIASTSRDLPQVVSTVAETLSKVRVSTHSDAIMLDATDWGTTECQGVQWQGSDFTRVAADLASALIRELKLFLRLPRSHKLLSTIDLSQLGAFNAFITPWGLT